jgi:hypothetical protein
MADNRRRPDGSGFIQLGSQAGWQIGHVSE